MSTFFYYAGVVGAGVFIGDVLQMIFTLTLKYAIYYIDAPRRKAEKAQVDRLMAMYASMARGPAVDELGVEKPESIN